MFSFNHFNFNVFDLERSLKFYDEALGLKPVREKNAADGRYKIVFLGDGRTDFQLELTWLRDREQPYDLGEQEYHLALRADDFAKAYEKHKALGCICFENPEMGIYFLEDPDGYWIEIIPTREKGAMKIAKMHGAGNDFVILNSMEYDVPAEAFPALARTLCAFHTGVGADGMMVVVPPVNGGDYGMLFYNSDGSVGEMCGNGARCICRYGYDHGLAGETQRVETTAGLIVGERIDNTRYRVRLNDPSVIDLHRTVWVDITDFDCAYLELGDPGLPQAVLLMDDWDKWDKDRLRTLGRALRFSPAFPKGANISFVKLSGPGEVKAVTYERGVEDFTLACGTGCGSIAAALSLLGLVEGEELTVYMPGGTLSVCLTKDGDTVRDIRLTGPTRLVFEGEVSDEQLAEAGV